MQYRKGYNLQSMAELRGQMVDIFEDYCDDAGIMIANIEREDSEENTAHIYGSDYDAIAAPVEMYILGEIKREEISIRMLNAFMNILIKRGAFAKLHYQLEDTIAKWTNELEGENHEEK